MVKSMVQAAGAVVHPRGEVGGSKRWPWSVKNGRSPAKPRDMYDMTGKNWPKPVVSATKTYKNNARNADLPMFWGDHSRFIQTRAGCDMT